MSETRTMEYKEKVTDSFLKTVSAFANYNGGTILFGVDDDGNRIGFDDAGAEALVIENKINDSIRPLPTFEIAVDPDSVVTLKVHPGPRKPYYYRSKSYRRSGTSTIEADPHDLSEMIMESSGIFFEQLPAKTQQLSFESLSRAFRSNAGVERFDNDTLKTLGLMSLDGVFNNAATLLADRNDFPGTDIARFGETMSIILNRKTFAGCSLIDQLENSLDMFSEFYEFEEVVGFTREKRESIPKDAFREALANALVHRAWDIHAHIRISMFDDRIEIASPGGLPRGLTEKEYLRDDISVLRNPSIANVFLRLHYIEAFGTGVRRILDAYDDSASKPMFKISENVITVTLPLLKKSLELEEDEKSVYDVLSTSLERPLSAVTAATGFSKSKTNAIMKGLVEAGLVEKTGGSRTTKYRKR